MTLEQSYLMEVRHRFGDREVHETVYIEADDRQMVKYWFHNHYKEFGHNPTWATNKHIIDIGGGEVVELWHIERIDSDAEAAALEEHLAHFSKE